ncbi:MAG: hypothetical protein KDD08_11525, partial [Mangrovimonas sp.]|nr:hypothetical protein [Mangrovimonas sp.]
YNLSNDIGETKNLSQTDSLYYNRLQDELNHWESKMIDPLWGEEKPWMDVTYYIHKQLMQNKEVLYKAPPDKDDQQ